LEGIEQIVTQLVDKATKARGGRGADILQATTMLSSIFSNALLRLEQEIDKRLAQVPQGSSGTSSDLEPRLALLEERLASQPQLADVTPLQQELEHVKDIFVKELGRIHQTTFKPGDLGTPLNQLQQKVSLLEGELKTIKRVDTTQLAEATISTAIANFRQELTDSLERMVSADQLHKYKDEIKRIEEVSLDAQSRSYSLLARSSQIEAYSTSILEQFKSSAKKLEEELVQYYTSLDSRLQQHFVRLCQSGFTEQSEELKIVLTQRAESYFQFLEQSLKEYEEILVANHITRIRDDIEQPYRSRVQEMNRLIQDAQNFQDRITSFLNEQSAFVDDQIQQTKREIMYTNESYRKDLSIHIDSLLTDIVKQYQPRLEQLTESLQSLTERMKYISSTYVDSLQKKLEYVTTTLQQKVDQHIEYITATTKDRVEGIVTTMESKIHSAVSRTDRHTTSQLERVSQSLAALEEHVEKHTASMTELTRTLVGSTVQEYEHKVQTLVTTCETLSTKTTETLRAKIAFIDTTLQQYSKDIVDKAQELKQDVFSYIERSVAKEFFQYKTRVAEALDKADETQLTLRKHIGQQSEYIYQMLDKSVASLTATIKHTEQTTKQLREQTEETLTKMCSTAEANILNYKEDITNQVTTTVTESISQQQLAVSKLHTTTSELQQLVQKNSKDNTQYLQEQFQEGFNKLRLAKQQQKDELVETIQQQLQLYLGQHLEELLAPKVAELKQQLTNHSSVLQAQRPVKRQRNPTTAYSSLTKCFYTAIFTTPGQPADTLPAIMQMDGWDYICFTNIPSLQQRGWTIVQVPMPNASPVLSAKNYKWRSHLYLSDYDLVVWMDAYLAPNPAQHQLLESWITEMIRQKQVIGHREHDARHCIYEECDAVVKSKRDTQGNVQLVRNLLQKHKMPRGAGLFDTNIVIRFHKSAIVQQVSEAIVSQLERISPRDQLAVTLQYYLFKLTQIGIFPLMNAWEKRGVHVRVPAF